MGAQQEGIWASFMANEIIYKQCFHDSSMGIIITDDQGSIVDVNKQAENIFKVNCAQTRGRSITEVFPVIGSRVMACLENNESKLSLHIQGENADHVMDITVFNKDRDGRGAVCTFLEMGRFEFFVQNLESYKKVNKQLEAVFNSSSDGIWVLDSNGSVLSINTAAEEVEGFKAKDVVGKSIADLLKIGAIDQAVTPTVLKTQKKISIISYREKTQKTLLVTGTPVFDENGKISLVVVNERDMTELTALREKIENSNMVTEKIKDELSELSLQDLRENRIVAESKQMHNVLAVALKLSRIEASNILILGESGTGKGLLAKFIHSKSRRKKNPIIEINCAALPENLLEAELFGYESGAFTGARKQGKAGLFELANKGTLFLDEIGDMPLHLQAKLLKYLDDHNVMRLGGVRSRIIDCMVVAATNQDLDKLVMEKKFRGDLLYRLNAFTLNIPPLRERPEDTFELVDYYLRKYNQLYRKKTKLGSEALALLTQYGFPGNVRELKNIIKKAVVISESPKLDDFIKTCITSQKDACFFAYAAHGDSEPGSKQMNLTDELFATEGQILRKAMKRCASTSELAKVLGISQPTAFRKMKKHGLSFPLIQK